MGSQNIINQFGSNNGVNHSFSNGGGHNDMTFFDSQIFSNGVMKQRSQDAARSGSHGNNHQIMGAMFASKSAEGGSQFFNRTGPIKIMHKNRMAGGHATGPQGGSQNQSQ